MVSVRTNESMNNTMLN